MMDEERSCGGKMTAMQHLQQHNDVIQQREQFLFVLKGWMSNKLGMDLGFQSSLYSRQESRRPNRCCVASHRWISRRGLLPLLACVLLLSLQNCCHGLSILSTSTIKASQRTRFFPPRRREGNLTSERWENKFNELVKFKEKYGHCNVPQLPNRDIPENYRELGTFCRNVRAMSFAPQRRLGRLPCGTGF